MEKNFVIVLACMLIGSWFLIGEKRSMFEKFIILFVVFFLYVVFMRMTGITMDQILSKVFK